SHPLDLHLCPTRRSSDLKLVTRTLPQDYSRHTVDNNLDILPLIGGKVMLPRHEIEIFLSRHDEEFGNEFFEKHQLTGKKVLGMRSEEHTSELQSPDHLVC